ncbi:MAG: hypothetical protein QHH09_00895 [Microgenomates group bacterium]|nr:hypothetical protein [Microgenomates group bacterium]
MKILNWIKNLIIKPAIAQTTPNPTGGMITLPFQNPTLGDVLSFAIRTLFTIAGLAALLYLVLGALSWVTSGGDKEKVDKAQHKIQAAVIGLIVLVAVVALAITLEQVVFSGKICLGFTCPVSFGTLLK